MSRERGARGERAPEQTLYDVIRHVRPLHRTLAKLVEDRLAGTGVTVAMRAVVERLHEHGPETVPQVARGLLLGRQFVQRVVNQLLEAGLAEALPNPAHRRSPLLRLTPEGVAGLGRIKAREEEFLREVVADLSPRDVEACLRVVAHLAACARAVAGTLPEEEEP
jgi:DNA-binding MarR family transcriptional regulator